MLVKFIINQSPATTRAIRFFCETLYFVVCYTLVYKFSIDESEGVAISSFVYSLLIGIVLWCALYYFFKMSRDRIRYQSLISLVNVILFTLTLVALLGGVNWILLKVNSHVSVILLFFILLNGLVLARGGVRQLIRSSQNGSRQNVMVFGTSGASVDLFNAITFSTKYRAVCFVSSTEVSQETMVAGLPVIQVSDIQDFASKCSTQMVVIPENDPTLLSADHVTWMLNHTSLSVCKAPSMDKAFDYESKLTEIDASEMLDRLSGSVDALGIEREIYNRVILVTGGGGSIGSELCAQIIRYNPSKLVIVELNEFALYALEQRLSKTIDVQLSPGKIEYLLGSVTDSQFLNRVFSSFEVDIVYHAAAYKHVPMMEKNIKSALTNNVLGAHTLAKCALENCVGKFILVSSDKAVRPTNVMGASKRMAELICSDMFRQTPTLFAIVRFGNVLGSSGSVIPKFKSQIISGGPVTVTHPDVSRYFMSVPEAVSLVLNAGQLTVGDEVFLLEMGAPVKILNLATRMIRRHGLQPSFPADSDSSDIPFNKIPIKFTGLRPGEKLFEELLVSGEQALTKHPKIFKSVEPEASAHIVEAMIRETRRLVEEGSDAEIKDFLKQLPIEYTPLA